MKQLTYPRPQLTFQLPLAQAEGAGISKENVSLFRDFTTRDKEVEMSNIRRVTTTCQKCGKIMEVHNYEDRPHPLKEEDLICEECKANAQADRPKWG